MNARSCLIWSLLPTGLLVLMLCAPLIIIEGSHLKAELTTRSLREQTYRKVVRPSVNWVQEFRTTEGRLPTRGEVKAFALTNTPHYSVILYDSKPNWKNLASYNWRKGVDFMICVPVDEWNLYCNSWNGREWRAWTD